MMRFRPVLLLLGALAFSLGACGSPGGSGDSSQAISYDYSQVLKNTVENVIVPSYSDLHERVVDLQNAVRAFQDDPSESTLDQARKAWVAARIPWEQSEAFLFGPVKDQGLDPAMDSWPVDSVQIDAILASSMELSADSIDTNLGGGLKGFHSIEYFLWGADHNRSFQDLASNPRELQYLVALTDALERDTKRLLALWADPGGYGETFMKAGTAGGGYYRQTDAVQQLINGMADICDEVANGKIADPFKAQDPALVESQFSYNSIQDFSDNIRSVRNIYTGQRQSALGPSLSSVIAQYRPELDAQIKQQIETSIAAIEAIGADGQPFRDAIRDPAKRDKIQAAQAATQSLGYLMSGEVTSLVVH